MKKVVAAYLILVGVLWGAYLVSDHHDLNTARNTPNSINLTQKVWAWDEGQGIAEAVKVVGMQHKETRPPFPGPTPILMASPACRPNTRTMMVSPAGEREALLAVAAAATYH